MTKFFVNIIESPSDSDFYEGISEGLLIKKAVELNAIDCYLRCTVSKKMFIHALSNELPQKIIQHIDKAPILHISAHGFSGGIGFSNGEQITWDEIKGLLSPYCAALHNSMLLCMSSCSGLSACQMAGNFDEKTNIFFAVIGHFGSPTWADTAVAYATFYHLLSKGSRPDEAVNAMKIASGDSDFNLITSKQMQDIRMKMLKEIIEKESQKPLPKTVGLPSGSLP